MQFIGKLLAVPRFCLMIFGTPIYRNDPWCRTNEQQIGKMETIGIRVVCLVCKSSNRVNHHYNN